MVQALWFFDLAKSTIWGIFGDACLTGSNLKQSKTENVIVCRFFDVGPVVVGMEIESCGREQIL
jgi:hypothetical protein